VCVPYFLSAFLLMMLCVCDDVPPPIHPSIPSRQVFGIVNSHVEFKHQPAVMDGCSDLLMDIFNKPVGYHARSAIGTNTLPFDVSVEIEMIVKFKSDIDDEDEDE
jgi:hypothetical protein